MKKKFSHVIAHYLPQCLLLISLLTSNVLFPATVIAQEIENTNNVTQEETVPIDTSEDILEEGISTSIYEQESIPEIQTPPFTFENGIYTVNNVIPEEEYIYPENDNVRVKFTEVTQEGNLIIKRVELTEEQKELLNTKDSYGWDITSSMENGTFKYNLTLPNTQGNEDIEVKYTEDNNTYESIDNSNIEIKSNVVTIEGLDHFTVFVVVNPLPDNYTEGASNCTIMTGSICYDTIQEAVTAATSGDTINVLAGEYHENITINKSLSLMGVGEGNKPTIVGGVIISTSGAVSIENMNFKVPSVTSVDSIHINNVDGELQLHVKNCSFDGSSQFLNGKRGIQSDDSQSKVTVEGSTFSNGYYIAIQGKYNELNISNSTISNCKSGINFQSGNNLSVTDTNISVVAQTISNDTYAVRFASDGTNTGNKMTLNGGKYVVDKNGLIADSNTYHSAIIVRSGASGVLKANNLSLGGEVVNLSGQKLDATKNWWGDLDPSDNIKNSGTGSIDYSPWWGEDYANDDHSSAWTWYTNDSIQEAVNVATSGDIVNVKAGTYYERVVINKSLRLYGVQANVDPRPSVGGRNGVETIVNGNGSQILQIDADDVEINGFEFVNGGGYMIEQIGSHSNYVFRYNIVHNQKTDDAVKVRECTDCLVSNNYIYDIAFPGDGIGLSGGTNSAIRNNELVNQSSENAAIYVYSSTNTSITGNIVRGTTQNDGIKLGNKKGYDAEGVGGEIKNNVVSDTAQDGISVYMSNVVVDGNEISGSSSTNGALYLAFGISNVTITNNKIHDNTSASGIKIESRVNASTVTINNNQIFNNKNYGLYNFANTLTLLNAKSNWWGDNDNSGPYDEWSDESNPLTNPTGNGNSVRGMVDYSNWTLSDTTKPTIIIVSPDENTSHKDTFDIVVEAADSGSGLAQFVVNLYKGDGTYIKPCINEDAGGASSYTVTCTINTEKYADGTYKIKTNVLDKAGNKSTTLSRYFIFDNTGPSVIVVDPIEGEAFNGLVDISIQASDALSDISSASMHIYKVVKGLDNTLVTGCTSVPTTFDGTTWNATINNGGKCNLGDGTYEIAAWAYDGVSNPGWASRVQFVIDTVKPTIEISSPTIDESYQNESFNIVVNASDTNSGLNNVVVHIYDEGNSIVKNCDVFSLGGTSTHTVTCNIDTTKHSDGIYTIKTNAYDLAGNMSQTLSRSLIFDNTNPAGEILGIRYPEGDVQNFITNDNTPILYGTCADNNGVSQVEVKVGNNSQTLDCNNSSWVSEEFSSLSEGEHTVTLTITDLAGNSAKTHEIQIVVDNTPPTVEIISPNDRGIYNTDVTLSGRVTDANPHHYWLVITKDGTNLNIPSVTGESSATEFSTILTEDGEYHVTFAARDAAGGTNRSGNRSGDINITFTIDKIYPDAPTLTGDPIQYVKWGNVTRTWLPSNSTDVDYYMYKNMANGWTSGPYDAGSTEYSITHNTGNYDRIFEWKVSAVDYAGNETWSAETHKVVVDGTKPTVNIENVRIIDKKLTFTVSGTDNLSGARTVGVNIYNANNNGSAVIPIGRLAHNIDPQTLSVSYDATDIDLSGLESGVYTIRASIRDYSGNIEYATHQIEVDNTAPRTTLTDDLSGKYINQPILIEGVSTDTNGIDSVNISYRLTGTTDWIFLITIDNTSDDSPYNFTHEWEPTSDGTYDIKVSAIDIAGNIEQDTYISSLTYDSVPPSITEFNIDSGILNVSAKDLLSDIDKIQISTGNEVWKDYTPGMNINDLIGTQPGTYTIYVKVTDKAGNPTEDSMKYTIPQPIQAQEAVLGATTTKTTTKGITSPISTTQTEEILETTSIIEEPSVLGERCENKKKVSGYVYIDKNKDKEMNDNEEGIKDITLTIQYTDEEGNIKTEEEVNTDEKGYWETQLCSGKYNIVVKEDTLPQNIEVAEVLSLTVSDNEKETIFNIQALDTRNFWQKYWYLIVGGLAIIVIGYISIKNRKKEEI